MEVHFEDLTDYIGIQNEIQELFYEKLLPAMEAIFDEITGEKINIVIDQMEIDCGMLNSNRWKEELVEKTLREIHVQLNQQQKKEGSKVIAAIDEFLFFLENGRLPWNSRIQSVKELELRISEKQVGKEGIGKLKALLSNDLTAAERLLYNFSESFVRSIMFQLTTVENGLLETFDLLAQKKMLSEVQRKVVQTQLLKLFAEDSQVTGSIVQSLLEEVKKNNFQVKHKKKVQDIEHLYVHNAGVVLIHPFLPELFYRLGLWVNKKWKDETAQHTAVRVLEYMATGNRESEEFALSFNKVMCGVPLSAALLPAEVLSASTIAECEELLQNVIQHWSAIGNTGIEGLRESFLHREGKLQRNAGNWLLNVERSAIDVLIDYLPWGVSVVALPWMDGLMYVDWRN